MSSYFFLLLIPYLIYPDRWNYLGRFFQKSLNLEGYLYLIGANDLIKAKTLQEKSQKFGNPQLDIQDLLELNLSSKTTDKISQFSKYTNSSAPLNDILDENVKLTLKENIDDLIYLSDNYKEFFEIFNISPSHWRTLFLKMKTNLDSLTISQCLTILGVDLDDFLKTSNIIFSSFSKKGTTTEEFYRKLGFSPMKRYTNMARLFNELSQPAKIITPNFSFEFYSSFLSYLNSMTLLGYDVSHKTLGIGSSYLKQILNFDDLPIRTRLQTLSKGLDRLCRADPNSPFRKLIPDKIDFLSEFSSYVKQFLSNDFWTRQFFVNFLKCDSNDFNNHIQIINDILTEINLIESTKRYNPNSQLPGKLNSLAQRASTLISNGTMSALFVNETTFKDTLQMIINLASDTYSITGAQNFQNSLINILNGKSSFEKELSLDFKELHRDLLNMKNNDFRTFLNQTGNTNISESITDISTFLINLATFQKKHFGNSFGEIFNKFHSIGTQLKNPSVKASDLLESLCKGSSVVIDVILEFTEAVNSGKSPSDSLKAIRKTFIDADKSAENIISLKMLSLKNIVDSIVIQQSNDFSLFNLIPLNLLCQYVKGLEPKAKNGDITLSDLKEVTHSSFKVIEDSSNAILTILTKPIIQLMKKYVEEFGISNIDIDVAIERSRKIATEVIENKPIGIDMVEGIFITLPPEENDEQQKKVIAMITSIGILSLLVICILIILFVKVSGYHQLQNENTNGQMMLLNSYDESSDEEKMLL
ncbi:hypothetical protein TRFO_41327 [Tritrichomonas foetus]|uniref:Uncharacterized protein n=1 Tax=Tritrichomonas foetus TaxID=1144522 RepID=A0A1J4L560_9EUKA|nr:hypothetical protein TRFO_41327 [Tritrichomonas foetus]|eukprot:OHT17069.1 hypothetical protein TRFO_41327 [Tritrichomonas foetus]